MIRLSQFFYERVKTLPCARAAISAIVLILGAAVFSAPAQTVVFNAPFSPVSQTSVTYGQGIVADANSNLYITGTVNLLFLQRNPDGSYTPASTKIDSVGGTAYGLAIDAANNLYRPDIAPGSNPYLAKYIYQSVNTFTKAPIGTWTTANSPSSVAVDPSYNVYVLDAGGSSVTTGSLFELTPGSSCSSNLPACTTYTRTTLLTDTRLHSTSGLSMDSAGNFYVTSGSSTGNTPNRLSNSTEAVYKLIPGGGTYSINALSSGWSSPAASAVDSLGNVWVADYGAQKVYQLVPQSLSPTETNYTKAEFQSATNFTCLRTLTVSKTGQLFGLETGGSGCNSAAIPEVGGTAPHSLGSPALGTSSTQEVDVSFSSPQPSVNYSVVTQGSTTGGFGDATPSSGSTTGGTPYCSGGTSSGDTCAVIVAFAPAAPGLQMGALLVRNSSGVVIATDYLYGVGYAAEAALKPGAISTYATASLSTPVAEAMDVKANVYVADPASNMVLKITPGGTVSTLAGTGYASNSSGSSCGGALATNTNVTPTGVALDGAGTLYFSDLNENRVCAVNSSTGIVSTVAGTGATCSSSTAACGDGGAATNALLALGAFSGLAVDELGNLLIADSNDNRIRSVNPNTGTITTVAGSGSVCPAGSATCGDGGQATASGAYLNYPTAIAVSAAGDYLIADMNDNRIRKISQLTSVISTVAGNGTAGSSGDGALATAAELNAPTGIAADAAGDIYIADQGNSLIRMVTAGNGNIMTLAGGGASATSSTPMPATSANFQHAAGIAVDTLGNLYVADTADGYIGKVNSSATTFTFPSTTTVSFTDSTDGPLSASLTNIGNIALAHGSPAFSAAVDFQQVTGNSTDCISTFSLGAGVSCSIRVQFVPQTIGSLSESFVIADNSLDGNPATQTITLIGASSAPVISLSPSGGTLAADAVAVAYSQGFVGSGGTSPYTYAITAGSVPAGLTLSSGGSLSGTPTSAGGPFSFTVTATDSSSGAVGGPFSGNAAYALTITQATATVSLGNLAQTYSGSALAATASTSPAGLTVSFTYNGSATAPTAAGSYAVIATINNANYQGSTTGTLVISQAVATVSLGNLAQTYTGSPQPVMATTSPAGLTVSFTYNGSATAPTSAGSYAVLATINNANYQGTTTGTLVVGKAVATVSLGNLAQTYTGSPQPVTASTSAAGLTVSFTYDGGATAPIAPGSYAVIATINNANYQGTASGTLVISQAAATVSLGNLTQTYSGSPLPVTATTSPNGLTVSFTYNGSVTAPTSPGTYAVIATISNANYQGTAGGTLVISQASATASLGNLAQTYTGFPLPATATTSPAGLTVSFTYNGSATAPTAAGSYAVIATINNPNYQGSTSGTLVISQLTATASLGSLAQTYTGSPLPVTATTSPAGLTVSFTYNGSASAPTAAGSYVVVATINSTNYRGTISGTLVISPANATVSLGYLAQTYTGSPLPVTATTSPAGIAATFTYNGNTTAPISAGSYAVVANINNANYRGTSAGTLVISKATATVSLGNLANAYTGSPLLATATTSPAGLRVTFTYNGNATAPAAVGSYAVIATVNDVNYQGTATGPLVISQQKYAVQWATPAPITYGTALTAAQLDATSSAAGSFVYNPSAGTVLGGGAAQTLSVTFTPSDLANPTSTTQTVRITVNQATAAASVSSNANPSFAQTAVTLSVTVTSTVGTPTGSVTFLDGTMTLGASTLSAGTAHLNVSSLVMGAHSITAVYNGDANFLSTASGALAQNVIDFGVSAGTPGGSGGASGQPAQTVAPGGTATYTISIAPTAGSTFPTATLLTVTGLPKGATATLTSAGWTPVTSASWSLPAKASLQDVSLSLQVPGATAKLVLPERSGSSNRIPPLTLALLLLPYGRRLRRVRLNRVAALLIALGMVGACSVGPSGCGAGNGFFGQQQHTYNVTVTITTGTLSHSTYLALTVE